MKSKYNNKILKYLSIYAVKKLRNDLENISRKSFEEKKRKKPWLYHGKKWISPFEKYKDN